VIDVDGARYIDGLSGTFCANLGHANRALADAGADSSTSWRWRLQRWPPTTRR